MYRICSYKKTIKVYDDNEVAVKWSRNLTAKGLRCIKMVNNSSPNKWCIKQFTHVHTRTQTCGTLPNMLRYSHDIRIYIFYINSKIDLHTNFTYV